MAHELKAGDLALIVGAHRLPDNIGKTCTLLRFVRKDEFYSLPDGTRAKALNCSWLIEGDGITGITRNLITGEIKEIGGSALVDPRHLMPLRGDFNPEQQKSKEAEPCA